MKDNKIGNRVVSKSVLLAAFLVGTILLLSLEGAYADVWYKVFSRPYDANAGNTHIWSMSEFGGNLYAGATRFGPGTYSSTVYRLNHDGCRLWDNVSPPWSQNYSGPTMAMAVFNNKLYVANELGQIFNTDGNTWTEVTGNLPHPTQPGQSLTVYAMEVFNGQLYVVYSGSSVWRLTTDTVNPWQKVWSPTFDSPQPDRANIESLRTFNGYLYAGVGLDNINGIQIWRTADGTNWTIFRDETNWPSPIMSLAPGHVHAMKPFNGYLYIGSYHGVDLFRTTGVTGNWDVVTGAAQLGSGDVFRLQEHNANFYLGTSNISSQGTLGTPMLYVSSNGTQWSAVPGGPVYSADTRSITSLASFNGKLYVATTGDKEIAIYELGPAPAPTCVPPVPDLKINGSDGPLMNIAQGSKVTITVSLQAGSSLMGKNADWWLAALYFDAVKKVWLPLVLNIPYPLFDLPPVDIWKNVDTSGFPKGIYLFAFGVDMNMNNLIDFDELYFDVIGVNLQ